MKSPNRLSLALLPTPLHRLETVSSELQREIFVKRDDMTGSHLSGNKIRKLEFLLARAKTEEATHVLTCGGMNSNHCRATALASASLGLKPVLLLRTPNGTELDLESGTSFNNVLNAIAGARCVVCDPAEYRQRHTLMATIARDIEREGGRVFIIPEGGSNALGSLGYVEAARELAEQLDDATPTTVVVAVGSGGTYAGLRVGLSMWMPNANLIGFPVCDSAAFFHDVSEEIAQALQSTYGLPLPAPDRASLLDGAQGEGYGLIDDEGIAHLIHLARTDGLVLDHVYSAKAFVGMRRHLEQGDPIFAQRIVFIHTGGLFGIDAIAQRIATFGSENR